MAVDKVRFELWTEDGETWLASGLIAAHDIRLIIEWRKNYYVHMGVSHSLAKPVKYFETKQPAVFMDSELVIAQGGA